MVIGYGTGHFVAGSLAGAVGFGTAFAALASGPPLSPARAQAMESAAEAPWNTREETWSFRGLPGRTVTAYPAPPAQPSAGNVALSSVPEVEILKELHLPDGTVLRETPSNLAGEGRTLTLGERTVPGTFKHAERELVLESRSTDGRTRLRQVLNQNGSAFLSAQLLEPEPLAYVGVAHRADGTLWCDQGEVTFVDGVYHLAASTTSKAISLRPLVDPRLLAPGGRETGAS